MFLLNNFWYLVPEVVIICFALYFWRRSRHSGFAWIAAAIASTMVPYLLIQFVFRQIGSGVVGLGSFQVLIRILHLLSPVLFIIALRSFFLTLRPDPSPAETTQLLRFEPQSWPQIKRKLFGVAGVALILGGIYTILRGVNLITQYNGELADLGAGPGAIVVGVMSLALGFHPRSPLNKPEVGNDADDDARIAPEAKPAD